MCVVCCVLCVRLQVETHRAEKQNGVRATVAQSRAIHRHTSGQFEDQKPTHKRGDECNVGIMQWGLVLIFRMQEMIAVLSHSFNFGLSNLGHLSSCDISTVQEELTADKSISDSELADALAQVLG